MNIQTIKLDLSKTSKRRQTVFLRQGDVNGTTIVVEVEDNHSPFDVTGKDVTLVLRAPRGEAYVEIEGTADGNTATFLVNEAYAAATAGKSGLNYMKVEDDGTVSSTGSFDTVVLEDGTEGVEQEQMYTNGLNEAIGRANAAAEAAEGIVLQDVPQMSATLRGGAKLGRFLALDSGALGVDLDALTAAMGHVRPGRYFDEPWSTKSSSSAAAVSYDARFDLMHEGHGELENGTLLAVQHVQMHYCLPFDTPFSPDQAFLYAIDGLPAGTYHVKMGFSWGSNVVANKYYQFTLTKALPAGGQLAGFNGAPDQAVANWRVNAYASPSATSATETVTVSEGSGGTDLGTFTTAGVAVPASGTPETAQSVTIGGQTYTYYGLNSLHRVAYGNNRWLHSPLRQYLNSNGFGWWQPATVFDRPPSYAGRQGFLSGFDAAFLATVKPIKRLTALNYVSDGGTSAAPLYDTTFDLFTLPSGKEHFLTPTTYYGGADGLEGEAWDYWADVAGTSSPLEWSTWGNTSTYHPEYVQYDLAARTTARIVWMRSATRTGAYLGACVGASGYCYHGNAARGGYRAAPACAIG